MDRFRRMSSLFFFAHGSLGQPKSSLGGDTVLILIYTCTGRGKSEYDMKIQTD